MTDVHLLKNLMAERIAHGLTDDDLANDLLAVGGQAHLEFGRLVKSADLVALARHLITTPEPQWIPTQVGDDDFAIQIVTNQEGVVFDLWPANEQGNAFGDEPIETAYMIPDDILAFLGVAQPWNQPWMDEDYNPDKQPTAGIRSEEAAARLQLVTDAQLAGYESYSAAVDGLNLWDLDENDRRALHARWTQLHPAEGE